MHHRGHAEPEGVEAAVRKREELYAMNAVFAAEKALGPMAKDVSAQRGRGDDSESIDAEHNLLFIEAPGVCQRHRLGPAGALATQITRPCSSCWLPGGHAVDHRQDAVSRVRLWDAHHDSDR